MWGQWHTSKLAVRFSTNVGRANNSKGSSDCRNFATTLCVLGCVAFNLLLLGGCGNKNVSAAAAPPPNVQIVEVIQRDVPVYHEWIATLDGYVNAQIQPQVAGYLIKQNYREGALVSKNEVLFKIDPRPFQAVLDQAKAQLAQAEAQLGKTQLDVQRDTPLAKEKAIAQSQLDNDVQANLAAKATVQADKAAIEQAEINLEFTNVRSLIDGVAGIATGQVGNLVGPQAILTTVSQLDPIKAYFVVSEQQYLAFVQRNPTVAAREKTVRQLVLDLVLADGMTYARKGKNTAACASSATSGQRRCWYRRKQSRSSRACTRWLWSATMTKLACGRSRWESGAGPCGLLTKASNPASELWWRACKRSGTACPSKSRPRPLRRQAIESCPSFSSIVQSSPW